MVRGHRAEREIVETWDSKYNIPIFTSGAWQVKDVIALENDLDVPSSIRGGSSLVRAEKLQIRHPIHGASRLLEILP